MADVRDRDLTAAPTATARTRARPVILATLQVRIDPAAEEMAVASALEAGVPLIVANMVQLPPYPATVMLVGAENATLPHEEALEEVRATAKRAAALGIPTELLRSRAGGRCARCSSSSPSATAGCSSSARPPGASAGRACGPPSAGCDATPVPRLGGARWVTPRAERWTPAARCDMKRAAQS